MKIKTMYTHKKSAGCQLIEVEIISQKGEIGVIIYFQPHILHISRTTGIIQRDIILIGSKTIRLQCFFQQLFVINHYYGYTNLFVMRLR